jgi:hypothetical protein
MTDIITPEIAADRIETHAREGRLLQGRWHLTDEEGRHLACLLGAIGEDIDEPAMCPASVMPPWLAYALPELFDCVRPDRAIEYGLRFAAALRTGSTSDKVRSRLLVAAVCLARDAAKQVDGAAPWWGEIDAACGRVIRALEDGTATPTDARAVQEAMHGARTGRSRYVAIAAADAAKATRTSVYLTVYPAVLVAGWAAADVNDDETMTGDQWRAATNARMAAAETLFDVLLDAMEAGQ